MSNDQHNCHDEAEHSYTSTEATDAVKQLIRCINFASTKHKNQKRKDPEGTPYINHPIGVANILSEEAGITDLKVLQTAILHDTVEDTETTFEELEREFGKEISDLVKELSDNKCLPYQERKRLQIVNAPNASHKAKLVKLADKIYNLRDLNRAIPKGWGAERVSEYFKWASQVAAGLRGTNKILDDILDNLFKERNISV